MVRAPEISATAAIGVSTPYRAIATPKLGYCLVGHERAQRSEWQSSRRGTASMPCSSWFPNCPPASPHLSSSFQHIGQHRGRMTMNCRSADHCRPSTSTTANCRWPGGSTWRPPDRHVLLDGSTMRLSKGPRSITRGRQSIRCSVPQAVPAVGSISSTFTATPRKAARAGDDERS